MKNDRKNRPPVIIYQQLYDADGWADFYWRIAGEYLKYGFNGRSHPLGTYEYDAYNQ